MHLGAITQRLPANDNALADYLESDEAQLASPETVLQVARLAKCAPLTALQMLHLQRAFDSA